jgi:hypothetical protein
MTRPRLIWLVVLLAAAGCRNNRSELVEAELRTRDRELREMRGELWQAQSTNEALENTVRAQQCNQPMMRPGGVGLGCQVKDIQLGRGTGGIDEDRIPGDEGIQVVLVPRDMDESPVKAPGTLRVCALEISPEGIKTPLSQWDISALQMRRSWKSGLLSTGYSVVLPWQRPPTTEKLRIVATFQPLEGGVFEAERDVTIKLLPEAMRGQVIVPAPAGLGPPLAGPMLPAPSPTPIPTPPTGPMPRPTPPAAESKKWQPAAPRIDLYPPDGAKNN